MFKNVSRQRRSFYSRASIQWLSSLRSVIICVTIFIFLFFSRITHFSWQKTFVTQWHRYLDLLTKITEGSTKTLLHSNLQSTRIGGRFGTTDWKTHGKSFPRLAKRCQTFDRQRRFPEYWGRVIEISVCLSCKAARCTKVSLLATGAFICPRSLARFYSRWSIVQLSSS